MSSHHCFPPVSPSRAALLACPKRFHEEVIRKQAFQRGFVQPLAFGLGIHESLKLLLDPSISLPPSHRDIEAIVHRAFLRQPYPDAALQDQDRARALTTVRNYFSQREESEEILAVELPQDFSLPLPFLHPVKFTSKFDVLLVRSHEPHCLIVCDYKTGDPSQIDLEAAYIALAIAKTKLKAISATYSQPFSEVLLEYLFLNEDGISHRTIISCEDIAGLWPGLRKKLSRIFDSVDYPAIPGELCGFCPIRSECQPDPVISEADFATLFG